ncbi:hypothetical protein S245_030261, partial [Arachis hypogaea]
SWNPPSVLSTSISQRYDAETTYYGEGPRSTYQNQLKENLLQPLETLFSISNNNSLMRKYKGKSKTRKFCLCLQSILPILDWGRYYTIRNLRGDFIVGLTTASLCIPQDIAYAKLANLDPHHALYASFMTPLVYAAMGSSRDIAIGPAAVVSLLLGAMLSHDIRDHKSHEYLRLAFTATFFAGVTQLALGILMPPLTYHTLLRKLIIFGIGSVKSTIVHHKGKKHKKLFWVATIAPMTCVIVSTICVYITRADEKGVSTIKHIKGVPTPEVHNVLLIGQPFELAL